MKSFYVLIIKRFFDFAFSLVGLIVLAPVFLLLAVLIKLTSKDPVLFKQKRVGKNKKLFTIHKFRTMRMDTPKDMPTHLFSNPDAYITKVGRFMRKTSLDELPQLWDVFRGKMALIGPRPALYNQYDLIELRDKYNANNIRPGVTGLAQIKGRDELELDIKAQYDGEYCRKVSPLTDIKILLGTVFSVLKGSGVKEGKNITAATAQDSLFQPDLDKTITPIDQPSISDTEMGAQA